MERLHRSLDDAMCAVDRVGTESIDSNVSTARADVQTMGRIGCRVPEHSNMMTDAVKKTIDELTNSPQTVRLLATKRRR